jgi:hypothetical protein
MKNLFLITFCLFLTITSINAQKDSVSIANNNFLNEHYKGGAKAFLELLYQNVQFPAEARNNCISGVSIITILFGEDGQIKGIQQKNPLDGGLEEEVSRITRLTLNGWNKNIEDEIFTFSIAFMLGERDKLEGYIKVIASGLPQYEQCPTTKEFEKKLAKALKKKKYEAAKTHCEQLLQRHPLSTTYLEQYEMIIKNLGL